MNKPNIKTYIASQEKNLIRFNHILMDFYEDESRGGFVVKTICNQRPYVYFITYAQAQIAIDYEKSCGWDARTAKTPKCAETC